ncbi:MAG: HEAT repeat domain-containing protein [Planctomycetes bacterium]|nr:HEAT repeat domain-containing protein [Planctomycetota bacterium]
MTWLADILSSTETHRLGWTLLHSLWQLAFIWASFSMLFLALRRRSASARYVAACAALASLERQRATVGPAMAARDDRDSSALARVRRILGVATDHGVRRTRVLSGAFSVFALVALFAGYIAVAGQTQREPDETTVAEPVEDAPSEAEKLVAQMRGMSMQARRPRSDGRPDPIEARRREILARLRGLGTKAVPALAATLQDADVQMRRNAALVLIELRGEWTGKRIVDIRAAVPALIKATSDQDADVRAWSAHALAEIGPDAVEAVPALIKLLKDPAEGPRNTSAIALGSIGPSASEAVPALTGALEDESTDVRLFAATALKRIRGEELAPRPDCLHWVAKDSGEVLFSLDDIARFDWNRQVFELTREKAMDFMAWQAPHIGGRRREFKVRDSETVFYEGRAISPVSSIPYDGPTIVEPSTDLPPPLFEIKAGYPEALGETDQRYHPRLQAALAKAGKLAAISTAEKLNPIAKTSSEWVGERARMRIRAEVFPETFRIGAKARAHVFFAPQGKNPIRPERIEIHSTLTTDGGTFFCATDHSVRDPVALSAAFRKGVVVLRWQPWGPVFGAEQSEAKPGPGEIRFQVVLRDAEGKAVGSYKPPAIKVTILPPSDEKGDAELWSEPAAGLQGKLVVAKPRIGPSGQFRVDLQLKNISTKPISVTHGNPFDFEAQIRDAEDRSIKHTSMRVDVLYSTKTSVIEPQTTLAIPVSIKSIDGAKGSHLDTTTKIWTLPVGKYKLHATYKLPAGQLKLPTVDIEIAQDFTITAPARTPESS